jgi:cytochrome c biogenesis protein CcmG/thiol:disulfide interchange protein DsbE
MMVEIKNNFHVPIYSIIVNDDPDAAKEFLQQAGNPFVKTGVDDDDRIAKSLEVTATPSTFIIDKHGMVRYRYIGVISKSAWNEIIFPLVNQYKNES